MEIYGFEVRTGLSYRKARQPGSLVLEMGRTQFLLSAVSAGHPWVSRSFFYEQIEVGEIVKLFFPDGQKGCGRDGIV